MRNLASLRSPRIAVLALLPALLLIVLAAPCQAQEKATATAPGGANATLIEPGDAMRTVQSVVLFGLVSLAPVALLMITPFVRINIVLVLLRQALGSPQVPGNQVLMALSLLLSALVMRPVGERVYHDAVEPYMAGKANAMDSWNVGAKPIKTFMVEQILRTNHQDYLWSIYQHSAESKAGLADPEEPDQFPLGVVAPAFILSELTTALMIGFYLYLPFLIIDLVVSSVLAAMGLFMLPPTLVAMPVKLIVFVLIDGWLLVAEMLLSGFSVSGA
ncbi:flagellar type III secretion system pore protein FliP [Paludisphaera borealis]|uniref:Flagellar biosynthetic protein FliP n=1 Tax=Paludisphaera borealis TaxID=1387353 RepID=A0A1U7CT44_9BACT|nr:flagellar type III secretion system pore protein FliP [Paludisphaera borealis]APW62120.1 Flagellar biosynthetic protein FliP [Paludisphaera borealis]